MEKKISKGKIRIAACAAVTKKGRRTNNQDNFMLCGRYAALDHETYTVSSGSKVSMPFFASVCDGMGGEASGERASYEACRELAAASSALDKDFEKNKKLISSAILHANTVLCDIMQQEQTGRMGSTVISVLIQNGKLYYTNLGDSRIYILRGGVLSPITHDHTEGQSMVDAGVLTPEQLKTHPSRNKLNRHLGIFPEEMVLECAVYKDIDLQPGDKLLLASDGVFGVMSNESMADIMMRELTAKERAMQLCDAAYSAGSRDNMTAMIIDIEKAPFSFLPILCGILGVGVAVGAAFAIKGIIDNTKYDTDRGNEPASSVEATEKADETDTAATEAIVTETPESSEATEPDVTEGANTAEPADSEEAAAQSEAATSEEAQSSEEASGTEAASSESPDDGEGD